jgi:hypothetical protein
MSTFAILNEDNLVLNLVVVESHELAVQLFGNMVVEYGPDVHNGVGFTYAPETCKFIPPQPFPSWVFDEETCTWGAPVPYPYDKKIYAWDEEQRNWIEAE